MTTQLQQGLNDDLHAELNSSASRLETTLENLSANLRCRYKDEINARRYRRVIAMLDDFHLKVSELKAEYDTRSEIPARLTDGI